MRILFREQNTLLRDGYTANLFLDAFKKAPSLPYLLDVSLIINYKNSHIISEINVFKNISKEMNNLLFILSF